MTEEFRVINCIKHHLLTLKSGMSSAVVPILLWGFIFTTLLSVNIDVRADKQKLIPYKIEQTTLGNGLKVVFVPMPSEGLVTYWTLVKVGSGVEVEPGKSGFAHFFEHMLFRGEELPGEQIFINQNAYTTDDFTAYHSSVASEDLPRLIEIESHRFQNLDYSEEIFRTEAGAVYGEYQKEIASPWNALSEVLLGEAFKVHPYNHSPLGHKKDILGMPELYDYSLEFYRRYYRPDNMIIMVVGDFEIDRTLELIQSNYQDFKPGYDPIPVPVEPEQIKQRRSKISFETNTQPLISIAFKSPAFDLQNKASLAGLLLGELIAGQFSPLYEKLLLDQRRIDGMWSWFNQRLDPKLWGISLRLKDANDIASVENEVWAAIQQLRDNPVSQKSLETVRSYLRNQFLNQLSSPFDLASAIARLTATTGDATTIEKFYAAIETITPADIQQTANQWLRSEASTVVVLHSDEDDISASTQENNNSILMPASSDPIITIKFWIKVGSQDDQSGKEGIASITCSMVANAGSKNYSLAELIKLRDPLGTQLDYIVDKEMTTITWSIPYANLDQFYELLIETILNPGFRTEDFERIVDKNMNRLRKRFPNESDEELAQFALSAEIFRDTPYEHHVQGTVDSLSTLTVEDVKDFYKKYYTRENIVFAISGNYPQWLPKRLEADLFRLDQGIPQQSVDLNLKPIKGRRVILINKPQAATSISFGFPIEVRRGEREFYALSIANAWLGQHRQGFGRLFDLIRHKRGLNYGNYSYLEAFRWRPYRLLPLSGFGRQQQIFEVWIRSLPSEHADFALRIALRELDSLSRNGLSQEDFDRTRKYLNRYSRFFAISDKDKLGYAVDDAYYNISEGHLSLLRRMTDELTLEEVNAAIAKYLKTQNLVITIVTDDAQAMRDVLVSDTPSPIHYKQQMDKAILVEDKEVLNYPLDIDANQIKIITPAQVFELGE